MDSVIGWMMEGDPVIRWQTMRDLLDESESVWQAERRRTTQTGWGAQFLASMRTDGTWPAGRWTDTVWTLLLVMDCGLPPDDPHLQSAASGFMSRSLTPERATDEKWLMTRMDLCHLGFWLRIGAYFTPSDPNLGPLAGTILRAQMADGGWNCRKRNYPDTQHSSFHTTFNVLEGLSQAATSGIIGAERFREAEARAMDFMLAHQMYRSDRTGAVIQERFTHLTFPSHWHYTVLRGLDYMRTLPEVGDPRLADPIELLESRRRSSGRWPVEKKIPGTSLFDMEKTGDSRWNTLRALRVLCARAVKTCVAGGQSSDIM
jgi:hypothetical protein